MREMKDSGIEWIGLAPISWDYIAIKYLVKSRLGGSWGNDVVADNDEYNRVCMRIADFDFIKLKFKEKTTKTHRKLLTLGDYSGIIQLIKVKLLLMNKKYNVDT